MDFHTQQQGEILRIDVTLDRLDAAVAIQFKDKLRELTAHAPPRVLLDLQSVTFLDSSGLGAVVSTMKLLKETSALELAGLSPPVQKVFRLTRMDSVFTIHTSADQVMATAAA